MPILSILNAKGECLKQASHPEEAWLYYNQAFQPGDVILLTLQGGDKHCYVTVDAAVKTALVYLPEGRLLYRIPFGEERRAYPPCAFAGDKHLIHAQITKPDDIAAYRNLAENPADQRGDVSAYPHASANVETRNESVFAARNVIDGQRASEGHGDWPYQSWGIGARTDAYLTVNFGRFVLVDRLSLYLRADFPHDAYWTQGVLVLSDGTEQVLEFQKLAGAQSFDIGEHCVSWLRLERLVKCDMPSAFPALIELQAFGREL